MDYLINFLKELWPLFKKSTNLMDKHMESSGSQTQFLVKHWFYYIMPLFSVQMSSYLRILSNYCLIICKLTINYFIG